MNDLYALSQVLKQHPQFRPLRDEFLKIYLELSAQNSLDAASLITTIRERHPDVHHDIQVASIQFRLHLEESARLADKNIELVVYGEKFYPPLCYRMEEPPLTLSYLGSPAWLEANSLSVVGSREPTFESLQWMEKELSAFCAKVKPSVVSGGARGVDQKAHSLAVRHGLQTMVVLPSGLGSIYPDSLKEWIDPILKVGGCFISEYSYEQRMHKHLFHHRNRLIAALGKATLLVEARRRSGTLITAHQALQLGRPLWVVPGHPLDTHFGGSLDLLTEGAVLIRDAEDLLMSFNLESNPTQLTLDFATDL